MKPLFYVSLFTTLFLVLFYNTVTNMAGLYIASDLGGSQEISVYPMVFFGLGNALTIPLAKFLAERFGAARSLATCLLLFSLISLFCSNAPTFFLFVFFGVLLSFGFHLLNLGIAQATGSGNGNLLLLVGRFIFRGDV